MQEHKKALILYWHGLGDVIMLTPLMRQLYQDGYSIDLMCRSAVQTSHLLDECPYINRQITIDNPWRSKLGFKEQAKANIEKFNKLKHDYDWSGKCLHARGTHTDCKIEMNFKECDIPIADKSVEVFIPKDIETQAIRMVKTYYPQGYIFRHTGIEFHPKHNWDCTSWIKDNLSDLPVVNSGKGGGHAAMNEDINFTFVVAREAIHRVLSSSVMVHACDAMGSIIDVINYGAPDRKVWVRDRDRVKRIRESGRWI